MRRFIGKLFLKIGLRVCGFRTSQTVIFNGPKWTPAQVADWAAEATLGMEHRSTAGGTSENPDTLFVIHTSDVMADRYLGALDKLFGPPSDKRLP